ncbi:MAG: hypothetical protein ACRD3A_09110 [Terriglobales bacterium]
MKPRSWRTTVLGIASISAALLNAGILYLKGQQVDLGATLAAIMTGWALIHAADHASLQ